MTSAFRARLHRQISRVAFPESWMAILDEFRDELIHELVIFGPFSGRNSSIATIHFHFGSECGQLHGCGRSDRSNRQVGNHEMHSSGSGARMPADNLPVWTCGRNAATERPKGISEFESIGIDVCTDRETCEENQLENARVYLGTE